MKLLFTGANGQLGHELHAATQKGGVSAVGMSREELDITRPEAIKRTISRMMPDVIVNCAAYTAVDKAESEPDQAFAVNRDGCIHLAEACAANDIPLIHISTDYVFNGTKNSAYVESDPIAPLNVYGKSKASGETEIIQRVPKHIILRTSWLYGCHGNNFVKTMLRLGREREQIGVVDDQFGCPTHAADLAEAVLTVVNEIFQDDFFDWGIYHFADQGIVSWYEFAKAIFDIAAKKIDLKLTRLNALTTDQYPTAAARPAYSVLSVKKISRRFGIDPPFYRNSLAEMISRLLSDKNTF